MNELRFVKYRLRIKKCCKTNTKWRRRMMILKQKKITFIISNVISQLLVNLYKKV